MNDSQSRFAGPSPPPRRRRGSLDGPGFRARLPDRLQAVADSRFERYWQLAAVIEGSPEPESSLPRLNWVIAALRAHARGTAR